MNEVTTTKGVKQRLALTSVVEELWGVLEPNEVLVKLRSFAGIMDGCVAQELGVCSSVFASCDMLRFVCKSSRVRSGGSGKLYELMGFLYKAYHYHDGDKRCRIVVGPLEDLITANSYNGVGYDDLAVMVTESPEYFEKFGRLGVVHKVNLEKPESGSQILIYTTSTAPRTLRTLTLLPGAAADFTDHEKLLLKCTDDEQLGTNFFGG